MAVQEVELGGGGVCTESLVADALADEFLSAASRDPSQDSAYRVPHYSAHPSTRQWLCPGCGMQAAAFFCPQCVMHGNFTCSTLPAGKRFSDRRLALIQVCQRRLEMANDFIGLSEELHRFEDTQRCTDQARWRVQCLREHLNRLRSANDHIRAQVVSEERCIQQENSKFDHLQITCTATKKRLIRDTETLQERRREAHLLEVKIMKMRQTAVRHLVRDIFPLIEMDANLQPVRTASDQPVEYCRILEPILPLDGNYSAYHNYASQVRELPDVNVRNPLYEVPAGLGMVAQLLHVLVQILNFQMPDLVEYGQFLGAEMDESSFQKAVYQLNWNILTLCSSQGILVDELSLKETLGNLLNLIKSPKLGQTGPYDLSNVLVFTEDELSSTSDSRLTLEEAEQRTELLDTEGSDEADWETIPAASASVLPAASPQDQLTRSTLGSAVNAVSALFRSSADYDHRRYK